MTRQIRSSRLFLAGVLASALLLSACGGGSTTPSSSAGSKTFGSGATGVVHFWARSATSATAKLMVKEFNASHKHLKVVLTETANGEAVTKLATAIRAGAPPDLIGLNDIDMPIFSHEGAFMNLTKYVDALPYKSSLSPGHLGLATYEGKYYGVPYLADLSVLWYNKKLFAEAGISSPPTTFAAILADAKKVQALGHGNHGFSFAGDCEGCLGFTMLPDVWATGTHLISGSIPHQKASVAGNSALKQLLTLYRTIWADHLYAPGDRTQNGTTWGANFVKGHTGIFPGGYGSIRPKLTSADRANFADVPLPGPSGGYSTFDGGDDFAIPKGASNPSGAWEFIKFVLAKAQQLQYPSTGFTPVRTDLLNASYKAAHPFDSVALKALAKGYAPTTLAYNSIFNQPSGPWFGMFSEAVYQGKLSAAVSAGQSGFTQQLSQSGSGS
ncbi:extracellular solute-binding protein [Acidimicrobiaceae bacterium USS-CC1]|uniref:Extracellular solute-binding protein n=1 Tax=Acidiferrimicrobium australe TaxID=2664430 RepID=A0ABW9QND8_9ACTN|nr:extracellular solute-binding protein [Acidiferrimicrobium australe]